MARRRSSEPSRVGLRARRRCNGLARETAREFVEEDVNDGGGVESENLADQETADHGDAERPAQFGADAGAEGERETAEEGGHGGHHDGAEAEEAGFIDGVCRIFAVVAFGVEGEVHHHDAVLFDDADQKDEADDGYDAEIQMEKNQGKESADARGGQGGKDCDGMDEAFVEHAENNVDGDESGED